MHTPVLLQECLTLLDLRPGNFLVDGTVGGGGHAIAALEYISPEGTLLGLDWDPESARRTRKKIEELARSKKLDVTIRVVNANFAELPRVLQREGLNRKADRLLLDLGFSSDQISAGRGFSFKMDEPLIMRYDADVSGLTAVRVLNEFDERKIAEILKEYGEERFAHRIANAIVRARRKAPFRTTADLSEVVSSAVPGRHKKRLHPATRTFLALRNYINRELENLRMVLEAIPDVIIEGGRVAIISFNSLEDRIVKQAFRRMEGEGRAELLTKKPITSTKEEIKRNPRSRSAKLRVIKITNNMLNQQK